jgi:hypothetical protein
VSKENVEAADCLISEVVAEDSDKSLLRLMVLGKLGSALALWREGRDTEQGKRDEINRREERR